MNSTFRWKFMFYLLSVSSWFKAIKVDTGWLKPYFSLLSKKDRESEFTKSTHRIHRRLEDKDWDRWNKGHEKHTRQQHRYICSNAQLHFGKEDRQTMRMHITMGWHKLSPSQAEENWKVGVTGRRWKIGPTYCVTKSTTDKMTITSCYWSNWVKQKWILMSHIF